MYKHHHTSQSPPPALRHAHFHVSWWLTVVFFAVVVPITTTAFACAIPTFHGLIGNNNNSNNNKLGALSASQDGDGGALGKKAYNDDALFNFHMMTQAQKIRDYSAMDTFVDTNSLWNLAWHDSFVRNGLLDFVPPLTDTLNVLVVGGSSSGEGPTSDAAVVIVDDDPITTTTAATPIAAATAEGAASLVESQDSSCSFLAAVFDDENNNNSNNKSGEDNEKSSSALDFAPSYDCIMDQGLMADLLARRVVDHQLDDAVGTTATTNNNKEEMGRLLWEATKRIRDMGIYVASTPPLSDETKEYLTELGELLGLQWVFDLDGISDSNLSVSVARKYFKDELPSGWQSFHTRGLNK